MNESYITQAKKKQLDRRMADLGIDDSDLVEKFVLGSGPGGQKINKTASCVYLRHTPSGIEVKCQKARSRALNRFYARRELCDRFEEKLKGEKSARRQAQEKIRRQKRRRSRRQKQKILDEKRKQGHKKKLRKPVRPESQE